MQGVPGVQVEVQEMITTSQLKKLKELAQNHNLTQKQVADAVGVGVGSVEYWKLKLGIKCGRRGPVPSADYTVYDRKGQVVAFGTARECAEAMGIKIGSFYSYVTRYRRTGRIVKEEK